MPRPHRASAASSRSAESSSSETVDEESPAVESTRANEGVPLRFQGKSLYEVLGVSRDATADVVKRAYRRMALSCHPDLNQAPTATEEFQYLSRCHEILADTDKRAHYDRTGSISGADDAAAGGESSEDAYAYWRSIFPKITVEDIDAFRAKYEGGDEELEDLLAAHKQCEGDLDGIFASVPFASSASVARLCGLLNSHAGAKISRKAQTDLKRRLSREEGSEAAEAEAAMQQLSAREQTLLRGGSNSGSASSSSSSTDGLALILQQRARDRERSGHAFLAHMESKYASGPSDGGNKKRKARGARASRDDDDDDDALAATSEPSDAEFAAIQARLAQNKSSRSAAASASPTNAKKSKKK